MLGTDAPVRSILPSLNVVQIGGRSIVDRGRSALLPVLDEIVAYLESTEESEGWGDQAHLSFVTTAAEQAFGTRANPAVRAALLQLQRDFAERPPSPAKGAVLDGRDIGTVVCPKANG